MIFYIDAKTNLKHATIDFIEDVEGKFDFNWGESEHIVEDGMYASRMKEIFNDEEECDLSAKEVAKLFETMDFEIYVYTEEEPEELVFEPTSFVIWDGEEVMVDISKCKFKAYLANC